MIRSALSVAFLLCGGISAARAQPPALTLGEAVALAARNNPVLASARVDVQIAEAARETARGLDDFVADVRAAGNESHSTTVPDVPLQQLAAHEASLQLSLTKPLPTGGRIGLRLADQYDYARTLIDVDPTSGQSVETSRSYSSSFSLVLEQPVLRGSGPAVARADQRRARVQIDIAQAQLQGAAAAVLRDVTIAYWELAFATQELEIRRAAAASAREQLLRVTANIDVGKQPRSAAAEVEVAIALREQAVLAAEIALVDRALDLCRLCGITIEVRDGAMVIAADRPAPASQPLDGRAILELALARNPQLEAVRSQGQMAAIEMEVTENGLLPQLDLSVSGGPTGLGVRLSDALTQLKGLNTYLVSADLVFQQSLGRHAARGARDAAREQARKIRLGEADLAAQVAGAVAHGVAAVTTAVRQETLLAQSMKAAATDLEAEKARFEAGRSTSFDVLRRQEAAAAVELARLRAEVDHLKAIAALRAAAGAIFANDEKAAL